VYEGDSDAPSASPWSTRTEKDWAIKDRIVPRVVLISGLVFVATACSFGGTPTAPSPHGSGFTTPTPASPAARSARSTQPLAAALRECPVTPPNGSPPRGALPPAPYLGNGQLWIGLWREGLVVVPPDDVGPDGFLRMKFMWVRGYGVHGILQISGDEVGTGASIRARSFGYGYTGFNASSIFFPGGGCYRVRGKVDGAVLTFVTLVRTCSVLSELPPALRKNGRAWCAGRDRGPHQHR